MQASLHLVAEPVLTPEGTNFEVDTAKFNNVVYRYFVRRLIRAHLVVDKHIVLSLLGPQHFPHRGFEFDVVDLVDLLVQLLLGHLVLATGTLALPLLQILLGVVPLVHVIVDGQGV